MVIKSHIMFKAILQGKFTIYIQNNKKKTIVLYF